MMRIAAAGVLVLALLPAQPALAQVPQPAAAADAPVIKVISTGAAPKRALRYKVPSASASRVNMTMGMSVTMDMGGMGAQTIDVPTVKFGMNIDVKEVAPNGDINFRFSFADAAMEGPNAPPGGLDMLNSLAGVGTVTDRGVMRSIDFDAANMTNPMLKQILSSSGIDKLSAPLPEEAVGVGAKWEVMQDLVSNGIKMSQKILYELTALDDTTATMSVAIEQSGPAQKIAPEGMPPGAEVSLLSLSGAGTGTLKLMPGALALFGDMDITSKIAMEVAAEGQAHKIATETRMKMTITEGKR